MDPLSPHVVSELASPSIDTRLRAAMRYAKAATRTDAVMLMCRKGRGDGFAVITNDGYPDGVAEFLSTNLEYLPEFSRPLRERALLSWEDTPDFPHSYSALEVLQPAGYNNGMTIALRDPREHIIGVLIMNMSQRSFPTEHKEPMASLNPLFTGFVSRRYEQLSRRLSQREQQVILLMREGLSNTEIGDSLALSPRTVATHVDGVFNKLGVRNRVAAVVEASRLGFFDRVKEPIGA